MFDLRYKYRDNTLCTGRPGLFSKKPLPTVLTDSPCRERPCRNFLPGSRPSDPEVLFRDLFKRKRDPEGSLAHDLDWVMLAVHHPVTNCCRAADRYFL